MNNVILESTLVCPECGFSKTEPMPTDACQWFYECQSCHTLLKPKKGDCCIFCSYGSVACPPVQLHGKQPAGDGESSTHAVGSCRTCANLGYGRQ